MGSFTLFKSIPDRGHVAQICKVFFVNGLFESNFFFSFKAGVFRFSLLNLFKAESFPCSLVAFKGSLSSKR